MKDLAVKFFLAMVFCLIGQRLLAAIAQRGMDMGLTYWEVLRDTFNYEYYPVSRIIVMSVMSAAIVLLDQIFPRKLGYIELSAVSAVWGAYYHAMLTYDYLGDLEAMVDSVLGGRFPSYGVAAVAITVSLGILLTPVALLVLLKLLRKPRAVGNA